MLFNIERDTGAEIVGYLVPDDARSSAEIFVVADGDKLWRGVADLPIQALVQAGRHATGRCGFVISETALPGLTALPELTIIEAATGLVIYRRTATPTLHRRVLRLETRLRPTLKRDTVLGRTFSRVYLEIDQHGAETTAQLFLLNDAPSLYLAGRLQTRAHEHDLGRGFEVAVAVRDPLEELAERLLILSGALGPINALLSERDRMIYGPAIQALDGVDLQDARARRRCFRNLRTEVATALSNPLARQLTTMRPDELCSGDAVSGALRTLAGFDLVTLDECDLADRALSQWLSALAPIASGGGGEMGLIAEIADDLAHFRAVEAMLEIDLEVHANVAAVIDAVAARAIQAASIAASDSTSQ